MFKFHRILIVPALLILLSCKGTGQPPGPFHDFTFNVDSTLLGESLGLSGMEIRLPRTMIEAPADAMTAIQAAAEQDTSGLAIVPERVFYDSLGGVLIFSHFRDHDRKSKDFVGFANRYSDALRARPNAGSPSLEWLTLGGIPALQVYTMDSLRVQFMYVLDVARPMHLAVSVPRGAWPQEVHAVESMLGTLRKSH